MFLERWHLQATFMSLAARELLMHALRLEDSDSEFSSLRDDVDLGPHEQWQQGWFAPGHAEFRAVNPPPTRSPGLPIWDVEEEPLGAYRSRVLQRRSPAPLRQAVDEYTSRVQVWALDAGFVPDREFRPVKKGRAKPVTLRVRLGWVVARRCRRTSWAELARAAEVDRSAVLRAVQKLESELGFPVQLRGRSSGASASTVRA
jgi:hypothetical protein